MHERSQHERLLTKAVSLIDMKDEHEQDRPRSSSRPLGPVCIPQEQGLTCTLPAPYGVVQAAGQVEAGARGAHTGLSALRFVAVATGTPGGAAACARLGSRTGGWPKFAIAQTPPASPIRLVAPATIWPTTTQR